MMFNTISNIFTALITALAVVLTSVSSVPQSTPVASTNTPTYKKKTTPTRTPTPTPTEVAAAPPPPEPEDATGPVQEIIEDTPTQETYNPPPVTGFVYIRPSISNVSAADIPSWINFNSVSDSEQAGETEETWNTWLYSYYNERLGQTWQYQPIEVHTHWWGDPSNVPSHNSIVNYIANKDALTVNFVVSANRVTSMMPLTWMATTTGYRNPYAWKMEIDPSLTEDVYKTVAALMYVVESKNPYLQNEPIRLHKEFYPTACADLDTAHLRAWVNKFASGEYDINTGQPRVVAPPPAPAPAPSPSDSSSPSPSS